MMNVLFVVQFFAIGLMLVSFVQLVRIQFLSKAIRAAIDITHERRMDTINTGRTWVDIPYPNIDATYRNLKWYKPWERPSTLLVYDKEA